MNSRSSSWTAAIAILGLTLAFNAPGARADDLPQIHRQGQIAYLSGGADLEEFKAIKQVADRYPLELELRQKAQPSDAYLSGVDIQIKDASARTILKVKADGPFLLARLPAGKYTVSADHDGQVESLDVTIPAKQHRHVMFVWQA